MSTTGTQVPKTEDEAVDEARTTQFLKLIFCSTQLLLCPLTTLIEIQIPRLRCHFIAAPRSRRASRSSLFAAASARRVARMVPSCEVG
jgi:hypothetical protein